MIDAAVLFWIVAAGFLVVDNLLLIPGGCDLLRAGRHGALAYDLRPRLEARGRELVAFNPFDPFPRAVLSSAVFGSIDPRRMAATRRELRARRRALAPLAWLGGAYLAVLVGLAALSPRLPFAWTGAAFLASHLLFWSGACVLLLRRRRRLSLSAGQAASLAAEAFFVPAYTVDLAKRVWRRHRVDVPALPLAVHRARRIADDDRRALYAHRLEARIALVEQSLADAAPPDQHRFLTEARRCLQASAPTT